MDRFTQILQELKKERDTVIYAEYLNETFFFFHVQLQEGTLNYLQIRVREETICFSVHHYFPEDNIFNKPREILVPQTFIGIKEIKGIISRAEELTKKRLFNKKHSTN